MTLEDIKLLFLDLCARLPYGVIIEHPELFRPTLKVKEKLEGIDKGRINDCGISVEYVKPYLRPMSSMTEEESKEFSNMEIVGYSNYDWLNAHHFDYRGLIERGLAIEVTEDNNPYKS